MHTHTHTSYLTSPRCIITLQHQCGHCAIEITSVIQIVDYIVWRTVTFADLDDLKPSEPSWITLSLWQPLTTFVAIFDESKS